MEPRYPYVHVRTDETDAEALCDRLWVLGASGIEERDASTMNAAAGGGVLLVASFADEASAQNAAEQTGGELNYVVGDAWRDGWRDYFHVTQISPRLIVRPSWEPLPDLQEGQHVITIDPGNAFGSGLHETTRLVLRALDGRIRKGEEVLDVGCGSGILSIGALLLGASRAVCTDIDPVALETTRENAEINGLEGKLETPGTDLESAQGVFPLVLANIQSHVLIPMADALSSKVAPGGTLILSGVLGEQANDVIAAYKNLELQSVDEDGVWRAITLTWT